MNKKLAAIITKDMIEKKAKESYELLRREIAEDVAKFRNDDDAMELVDKGGIDFASVDCKNEKDYRELLDSLRR